jgi:flagellar biosynthetic protein FliO
MVQQFLAVFLVLALLFGALWLLRRRSLSTFPLLSSKGKGAAKRMRVLERVSLTPQHSVHLITIGETILIVGVSPSGFHPLTSFQATTGLLSELAQSGAPS